VRMIEEIVMENQNGQSRTSLITKTLSTEIANRCQENGFRFGRSSSVEENVTGIT
jgi:hypothetical protein